MAQRASRGMSFFTLSLTLAPRVGGQRHAHGALPPGSIPGTHCTGDWVGPRRGLHGSRKSWPLGFDPRTVQPIASRETDCDIPAHGSLGGFG
jgi:hypothetical protein